MASSAKAPARWSQGRSSGSQLFVVMNLIQDHIDYIFGAEGEGEHLLHQRFEKTTLCPAVVWLPG